MGFKKEGEEVQWLDPSTKEIAEIREGILKAAPVRALRLSDVEIPVTNKLRQTLDKIMGKAEERFLGKPNNSLYKSIKDLVSSDHGPVDIVLPVYNSLHIVEPCIESVLSRTYWPYKLIIVDDASDSATANKLQYYASKYPDKIRLLTNKKNRGFAATVNKGILNGDGQYVCLLNSDVLVTTSWITKMVLALESDPRNQIVNPATNNTALIDIPMSEGISYLEMNRLLEEYAERTYPEIMPTGFCYMFRRELIRKIGLLDESFINYGEDSDHWMRCLTFLEGGNYPRFRAVMADDTYLFHERSSSFSTLDDQEHMILRKMAAAKFHSLWPDFTRWQRSFDVNKTLKKLREPIPIEAVNRKKVPYRICWVTYSTSFCGGMKFIADIVNEINERGGDARVALIRRDTEKPVATLGDLRTAPIIFDNEQEFLDTFHQKVFANGILAAATSELAPLVTALSYTHKKLHGMLHCQSYEPDLLVSKDPADIQQVKDNFQLLPILSNAQWMTKVLTEEGLEVFGTVNPGVERRLFYPRGREKGDERRTIMLPILPTYPFKGYDRGVKLIQQLWNQAIERKMHIRILTYGNHKIMESYGTSVSLGNLSQPRLAKLLGTEVDIFVDPSYFHSYGMPCLEAMASGVPVVSWDNKGVREYVKHGKSGLILPNGTPPMEMARSILDLLEDAPKREKLIKAGIDLLPRHDRRTAVSDVIAKIEEHFELGVKSRRIVVATPHMRKHGGPTTIINIANELAALGHDVSLVSVYKDVNPEVVRLTDLPLSLDGSEPDKIPPCDVLISNSDNPMNGEFARLPQAKKKIMLKLSHNPRFQQLEDDGLKMPWDAIVTSTDWLVDVCKNPLPNWAHPPVEAKRIGWFHYGHETFNKHPDSRAYGKGTEDNPIRIATLVHQHPLKGTTEAFSALHDVRQMFPNIKIVGVGEVHKNNVPRGVINEYALAFPRDKLAELFGKTDIWVGASHTEGLGRLALECMSAGAACVLTDTNAEFTQNEKNCLLVPIGDIEALKTAIIKLIESPDTRLKIAHGGWETAKNYSDPTSCIEELDKVIQGLFE